MKKLTEMAGPGMLPTLLAITLPLASAVAATPDHRVAAAKVPYFACDERVVEDRWQLERFVVPLRAALKFAADILADDIHLNGEPSALPATENQMLFVTQV